MPNFKPNLIFRGHFSKGIDRRLTLGSFTRNVWLMPSFQQSISHSIPIPGSYIQFQSKFTISWTFCKYISFSIYTILFSVLFCSSSMNTSANSIFNFNSQIRYIQFQSKFAISWTFCKYPVSGAVGKSTLKFGYVR
jgi:hypothetical protein